MSGYFVGGQPMSARGFSPDRYVGSATPGGDPRLTLVGSAYSPSKRLMQSTRSVEGAMGTPQPPSILMSPTNANTPGSVEVSWELQSRHAEVTRRMAQCFMGDVVPPSTKSQVLRSLKFFVYGFFSWNLLIFVYAFFIPAFAPFPHGGLDVRDFDLSLDRVTIMAVAFVLPAVRFLAFSWSTEFYHYVIYLLLVEALTFGFTCLWWSPGLPALVLLILSGLINLCVSQCFFMAGFAHTITDIESLVPKSLNRMIDHTVLKPGLPSMDDVFRILGVKDRLPQEVFEDRCGIYGGKAQGSHTEALKACYMQAMNPGAAYARWPRNPRELMSLAWPAYLPGVLYTFTWFAVSALAGLWLGQTVLVEWVRRQIHLYTANILAIGVVLVVLRVIAYSQTVRWLTEALGVAVAEKEWVAYDVLLHQGEREQNALGAVDMDTAEGGHAPYFLGGYTVLGQPVERGMGGGRLNLTFMWLCVHAVADFVGASYLAAICHNLSAETRFMLTALTPYEFKKMEAARWEITILMTTLHTAQMLLFMWMCVGYFGSQFSAVEPPVALMAVLGVSCIVAAGIKVGDVLFFAWTVLSGGERTPRQTCVSETIMLNVALFMFVPILLLMCLLPEAMRWGLPNCDIYRDLLPSACLHAA